MPELWIASGADIDNRLVKRFSLGPDIQVNNPYWLQRVILPVTNVDELLRDIKVETVTVACNGSTMVAGLVVPASKRWIVHGLMLTRSTGDRVLSDLSVYDGANHFYIDKSIGGTAFFSGILGHAFPMDELWGIYFNVSGGTTDGNWVVRALIAEEDAY